MTVNCFIPIGFVIQGHLQYSQRLRCVREKGGDDMRQSKKLERKLHIIRVVVYTAISFLIFQYFGIFALAALKGVYVKTTQRTNAFYPKAYVNVELIEKDDTNHVYIMDKDGNAYAGGDATKPKQFYVENPGTNKKDVVVRAKIVALIYSEDGTVLGETQDYVVTGEYITSDMTSSKSWYHELAQRKTNAEGKTIGEYTSESGNDGYLYYTSVLKRDTHTKNLFDHVQLTDISKIPEDGWVEFNVIVDTVEVDWDADDPYEKAKTAWGNSAGAMIGAIEAIEKNSST